VAPDGKPGLDALAAGHCRSCDTTDLLSPRELDDGLAVLPGWALKDASISKEFRFKSYIAGLEFANSIGKIAEVEDHHPDLVIRWRRVQVTWSTHSIKGLSWNDLVMAARTEVEYRRLHSD
jgi:4a-hydroxytetrahydrobiopterin dehydratase